MKKKSTILFAAFLCMAGISSVAAQTPDVIITEVYGGGGNSGATLKYDYVELYNTTDAGVNIGGWSLQYYAAEKYTKPSATNILVFADGTIIPAKEHFLIQCVSGGNVGSELPTPNVTAPSTFSNLSASAGKIVLYTTGEPLALPSTIEAITALTNLKDYVPFGKTAVPVWGSAMSANASATKSATRKKADGVYQYTQNIGNDFEITDPNPQNYVPANQVVAPEFTPAAGNYYSAQNVTITCDTEGAVIRYTTDGTEPTASSIEYTAAIPVSTTTTIKAKAYKESMDESVLSTATYAFPVEYNTIAELRAAATGKPVLYTGVAQITFAATSTSGNRNAKYIQDNTGAILIDDANGLITGTYAIGDFITGVGGTLSPYYGLLQFVAETDATKTTSQNGAITPAEKTLEELAATDQALLVKVKNVKLATGTFTRGENAAIDGTESVVIRPQYYDLDYIGETIPTENQDITAVVIVYNSTIQLVPRAKTDIVPSATEGVLSGKQAKNAVIASSGALLVNAAAGESITVYNMLGKAIAKTAAGTGETVIPVKGGQILLVKVGNQVYKAIAK
ncbi:MAG: chitobiase/beta-hexosaminidase C-terminal domain-containing protein [Prevotella sp.]|nr:chitobiase/beta-hexosaminidase C-terminal domain-containing protein [Prevotella sp.]